MVFFREWIMRAFISDPDVISEGARYLAIFSFSIPFFGIHRIFDSTFRGTGHTVPAMGLSLFRIWVLRLGLSAFLALPAVTILVFTIPFGADMGVVGIWIGMAASNVIITALSYTYFLSGRWKSKTIRD